MVVSIAHKPAHVHARGRPISRIYVSPDSPCIRPIASTARRGFGNTGPRVKRQRRPDEGRFASIRELAEAERVSSRIVRLNLLAPDVVERILDGRPAPQLAQLMQPFRVEWERQRERFC